MLQVLLSVPSITDFTDYLKDLVHYPPRPTSDAGELIVVVTTLALSLGLMVAFGQWWSR